MQKTKKQHYVPRCYLKAFVIPGTFQVHVYDKKTKRPRINNYEDVASENYFHDFSLSEKERESLAKKLEANGIYIDPIDDQYIEHLFANEIEPVYDGLLESLRTAANQFTPWYIQNCRVFKLRQKIEFAFMLALQLVRTKASRNRINDMVDCFRQALDARGGNEDWSEFLDVNVKNTHNEMILDIHNALQLAMSFLKHKWCLCVNQTEIPFITSDNPIATMPHVKNGPISMGGIGSEGVEIAFPIAPNALLVMVDSEYYDLPIHDLAFVPIDVEGVEYYNAMQVERAERCLFSSSQGFGVVDRVLEKYPHLFETPSLSMSWGGKIFYPKGK